MGISPHIYKAHTLAYTMKKTIKELQRKERKSIKLGLRIKPSESAWLKKNNVSPQQLFDSALEDLMKEKI